MRFSSKWYVGNPTYPLRRNRTHILVVPSQETSMQCYSSTVRSLLASVNRSIEPANFSVGRYCKWFAYKLHAVTHYQLPDMLYICKKAGILTPPLCQALKDLLDKRTICKTTGRPLNSKKVSFDKILREFNDHVQLDFFFIEELGGGPILHARNKENWILRNKPFCCQGIWMLRPLPSSRYG